MAIQRDDFLRRFGGGVIELARVRDDPAAQAALRAAGLSAADLARADLDGDGLVDAREAWRLADSFDRDGSSRSLLERDRGGQETRAGATVRVSQLLAAHPGASRPSPRAPNDPALRPRDEARPAAPRPNDDILHLGMGQFASDEVRHLRGSGARVTAVQDSSAGDDRVRVGGQTHDLATAAGVEGFVATLGLPAEQQAKVAEAIESAGPDARDELASLARVWAKGELGGSVPSRVVISGHHVGDSIWGDTNGELRWESLKKLADAMPRAAGQVEDLHLSACYSSGERAEGLYRSIFPSLKTVWGYEGSAPGTWSGAMPHLSAWEQATRGRGTDVASAAEGLVRRGVRKADHVDARSIDADRVRQPLAELRAAASRLEGEFERAFRGDARIADPHRGPVRDYYNALQRLLQHPDLPAAEHQALSARRDQTIRTLFYDNSLRGHFQEAHGAELAAGFRALGLEPADFSRLGRGEALAAIRSYRARMESGGERSPAAARGLELLNGLWNLDPRTLPQSWI
jgi:hypothetical protein